MGSTYGSQTRISLGLALVFTFIVGSQGSSLATFSDEKCLNSLEGIDGPNGYPNGTCTPLDIKGPAWKSFQIVGLDHGCTREEYPTIHANPARQQLWSSHTSPLATTDRGYTTASTSAIYLR
ncbi:hypothetical protein P171DRAFT_430516 [Karstenula rhodostoma CBS 690.94]|uniref:Uncharacterized protein n=1 Tax=Karstenula rhodostoma CBS 690.94 TaxID=1392251 RepID=A0A9P4PN70_9PLEO|nr:hypothetical protein P171DRAFT_430516 [Karstenula rhodostoma CBS 690.94]